MMITFFITVGIIAVCVILFGVGVFFFGKQGFKGECARNPDPKDLSQCLSKEAGICPVEDKSGVVKMATQTRITYYSSKDTAPKDNKSTKS